MRRMSVILSAAKDLFVSEQGKGNHGIITVFGGIFNIIVNSCDFFENLLVHHFSIRNVAINISRFLCIRSIYKC